jgi:multidrug resistance efflux pump
MDSLPPIPTPPAQRWREARIRYLPFVFFVLLIVGIIPLWRSFVAPLSMVGEVEVIRSSVVSIQDGTLVELSVDRFEQVHKDQPLGRVATADPAVTEATLNQIAADLRLMKARMDLDKIRNKDSYVQLLLNLQSEQVALALSKARIKQAEAELERAKLLFVQKIIAADAIDVAQRDLDVLHADIEARTKRVTQFDQEIAAMRSAGAAEIAPADQVIEDAIKAQQEVISLSEKPALLKAPIDGVVSMIFKRAGEKVVRGEVLVTVTPHNSERIIGYLRQPLNTVPTTNDLVQVRSRTSRRQIANTRILKVGTQLEPINPALLSAESNRSEVGLPVLVAIPDGMRLMPGEFVDLSIQPAAK